MRIAFRFWIVVALIGLFLLAESASTSAQDAALAVGSRVYIVNDGDVSVMDPADNQIVGAFQTGKDSRGAAISPDGTRIYVVNYSDHTISAINTVDNRVVTIGVVPAPLDAVVSPDGKRAYAISLDDTV